MFFNMKMFIETKPKCWRAKCITKQLYHLGVAKFVLAIGISGYLRGWLASRISDKIRLREFPARNREEAYQEAGM